MAKTPVNTVNTVNTKTTSAPAKPGKGKANPAAPETLSRRALNRATLARQLLLGRAEMSAEAALTHLVGLQAQNVKPPYHALAARLAGFDPMELSRLMSERAAVRAVTMRSTVHTLTADDMLTLRPLTQPAIERELRAFRGGLAGVDLDRLTALARAYVEEEPRTPAQLRAELLRHWPDADPQSLGIAARARLPLVQVTPRGLWRQSGQVALTTAEHWLGRPLAQAPAPEAPALDPTALDTTVLRYLAAFGPASVKDMQAWAGMTRLRDAFERLRPRLRTFRDERGVELFDLPDAPRPDEDTPAPVRFLPEFDNLLLSHADRTRVVPDAYKARNWKSNQSFCVFLVDGFLAGVWRLEESKDGAARVTVEPFGSLTKAERGEVAAEAERMARLLAGDAASYDIGFGAVVEA
ncbi:winged helix DNA-binding domain-containing protein [Streptomyces aureoverticillatus]|uniref:winged helix DNA-binding domain-containing protein n=1 Tax=Streptomyces aureoverticillatus TaxID=66871 RepID=UPI0013DCF42B|nr:winged helix DNA-binding domain-containing protein [Streptomyces aureoverticillatus]QIB42799.1 winged helix DNA-binding domain-containing protein [Streptomyces aureoverticillatus]